MGEAQGDRENKLHSDLDNSRETESGVEADTDVSAVAFGQAVSPKVSFAKAVGLEMQANMLKRLAGADAFFHVSETEAFDLNADEKSEKDERRGIAALRAQIEMITRQEERQRERDEWARTRSTVGGVTLDGEAWSKLAQRLRGDTELRDQIIAAFRRRGMSETEAEARFERVAEVAEIAAIPESQRTAQQQQKVDHANADRTFREDMKVVSAKAGIRMSGANSDLNTSFESAASGVSPPAVEKPTSMPVVRLDVGVGM